MQAAGYNTLCKTEKGTGLDGSQGSTLHGKQVCYLNTRSAIETGHQSSSSEETTRGIFG